MLIPRSTPLSRIMLALDHNPIVAIIGARQVGKTTLTYEIEKMFDREVHRFDLEDPEDLARLEEPKLTLQHLEGLIIIDEVQRKPELFPLLRVLVDRRKHKAQFLVLGSASPELLKQGSESLAGRISYQTLGGFTSDEIALQDQTKLWVRGGFPRSSLASSDAVSLNWRKHFIRTFLEQDIPQLGFSIPAITLSRFWNMLAHYHAQIWNGSELARAFGISQPSVKLYVDLLTDALVVLQLKPWHQNISKRQVKAPKIYIKDSGLLHCLLGVRNLLDLEKHPKIGASWEGFILGEILHQLNIEPGEAYFWATHGGAELDLLVFLNGKAIGFEIKRTGSPKITPSMHISVADLNLDKLMVIHAGEHEFQMAEKIVAIPMAGLLQSLSHLRNSS